MALGEKAPKEMIAPGTPDSVIVTKTAREPEMDPTLGIPVPKNADGKPRHRLVAIGDSLTHGFQSGAIFHTEISWPRIVAWEMGWDDHFRYPKYWGYGGMPLNLEILVRRLEAQFGSKLSGLWDDANAASAA